MDTWAQLHLNKPYDENGAWAAGGTTHAALLQRLLAHPYFSQPLPKSTGREQFDGAWLSSCLADFELAGFQISAQDVQATLCALTAHTIANAVREHLPRCQGVYICGGGALNGHLMALLQAQLACPVRSSDALGVAPQHMESIAFAWLARQCMLGLPGNIPSVTGALGPRVLGCINPA
mgnify:CR=1 FL=1